MLLKRAHLLPRGNPAFPALLQRQCSCFMSQELSLHQRRRTPRADEVEGIPWMSVLQTAERDAVLRVLVVGDADPGDYVCRTGKAPT